MPSLGADMEAGTLVEWLKQPGDRVKRGDIVAVVETQKGAIEIDIFEEGVIERWLVEPGTTVPVGTPLALIAGAQPAPAAKVSEVAAVPAAPMPVAPPSVEQPPAAGRARVSPAARRLAAERGVSLDRLTGSGPGGAIVSADIERAAAEGGLVQRRQSASILPRCAGRSPRRWRAQSARSHITILVPLSI